MPLILGVVQLDMSPKTRKVLNALTLQWQYVPRVRDTLGMSVSAVFGALDELDDEGAIELSFDLFPSDGGVVKSIVRLTDAGFRLARESHGTQKHLPYAPNVG